MFPPKQKKASCRDGDATRLTPAEISTIGVLLHGRVGDSGVRALADELGTTEATLRRAMHRRRMLASTIARLRSKIAARGAEPSGVRLTDDECVALTTAMRSASESRIVRTIGLHPATIAKAASGHRMRRGSIARIREVLAARREAAR